MLFIQELLALVLPGFTAYLLFIAHRNFDNFHFFTDCTTSPGSRCDVRRSDAQGAMD